MNDQQQPQVEIRDGQGPSAENKLVVEIFSDARKNQLNFLDDSGKSMIERIATFLTVLFAITALSSSFPPACLKDNTPAKVMVIVTLVLYLLAMATAMLVILPRYYNIPIYNVTGMSKELERITTYKMRFLRVAGVLFALGSVALAVLIVSIIWGV
jgi:sensor histidine kinase YesM